MRVDDVALEASRAAGLEVATELSALKAKNKVDRRNRWSTALFGAICVFISGFGHCLYGGSVGCTVIAKRSWTLHDTFVNVSEISEMSLIEAAGKGHGDVVGRMMNEGILVNPFAE